MPKIRVIDNHGEILNEIDCVGYNLQYVSSEGDGRIQKIRALNNGRYGVKYWIKNEFYAPIARKIKEKFKEDISEFSNINIDKILFLEDMDYIGDEVKREVDWVMRIKKAPAQLQEITGYQFIIESREFWMTRISNEQVVAHIYSVLKQIDDNKIIEPDVKGWKEVIGNLGYGWETTISPVINLLDGFEQDDFMMLRKADRQVTMFDRVAK